MNKEFSRTFLAEIKSARLIKKASLDNEYQITFATNDPEILELAKLAYDTYVKLVVEIVKDGR